MSQRIADALSAQVERERCWAMISARAMAIVRA